MKEQTQSTASERHLEQFLDPDCRIDTKELNRFLKSDQGRILVGELDRLSDMDSLSPARTRIWKKVLMQIERAKRRRRIRIASIGAAAAVVTAIVAGVHFGFEKRHNADKADLTAEYTLRPGSNKAILLLSEGGEVHLDASVRDSLISEGGRETAQVSDGGVLSYNADIESDYTVYNTLIVPRGGEFNIILSDGTEVFLDSESKLVYPVNFPGNERRVRLEGEGFFKVTKNASRPFVVESDDMEVRVLGTAFNINAYKDDGLIRTVVSEGRVEVRQAGGEPLAVLTRGQQACYSSGTVEVAEVDPDQASSWMNGEFNFEQRTLRDIMLTLERWYDINVRFEDESLQDFEFTGLVRRDFSAEQIFRIIEKTARVRFVVDGRDVLIVNER